MEPHVEASLKVLDRILALEAVRTKCTVDEARERIVTCAARGKSKTRMELYVILREIAPSWEFDNEMGSLCHWGTGGFAGLIESWSNLSTGEFQPVDVGDNLWVKPGGLEGDVEYFHWGRTPRVEFATADLTVHMFQVWFTFRNKRYQLEYPQQWNSTIPIDELFNLLNTALCENGFQNRFVCIIDSHCEAAVTFYANLNAMKTLQHEGLIPKYSSIPAE